MREVILAGRRVSSGGITKPRSGSGAVSAAAAPSHTRTLNSSHQSDHPLAGQHVGGSPGEAGLARRPRPHHVLQGREWKPGRLVDHVQTAKTGGWYCKVGLNLLYTSLLWQKDAPGLLGEGLAYTYLTSSHARSGWQVSSLSVASPASLPGTSLAPLYTPDTEQVAVLYNDEHPHGPTSFTHGHTKGAVVGGQSGLVWLIHSVPHFPPYPNETYSYPSTGQNSSHCNTQMPSYLPGADVT